MENPLCENGVLLRPHGPGRGDAVLYGSQLRLEMRVKLMRKSTFFQQTTWRAVTSGLGEVLVLGSLDRGWAGFQAARGSGSLRTCRSYRNLPRDSAY